MAVPLFQQKISKKKQKNLRNVLVLSDKICWPLLSESDTLVLNDKLKSCLGPVKIDIPRAPWYVIRSLSKEEKKKRHEEVLLAQPSEKIDSYYKALKLRKNLLLGVNSVCKALEDKIVSASLVDADVSPKILVSHVVELAKINSVPVLAVSNLKATLKSVLGFSSLAIGFKKDVVKDTSHIFYDLCQFIITKAESGTNSQDILRNGTQEIFPEVQSEKEEKQSEVHEEKINTINSSESISRSNVAKTPLDIATLLKSIYLYRDSETVRVFKPLDQQVESLKPDVVMVDDSIKLSCDSVDKNKVATVRYFKPLVVNKIQSNPKKKKNKKKKI